jgi:hypothetical protein
VVFWLPYKYFFTVTVLNAETPTKKQAKDNSGIWTMSTNFFRNCFRTLKKVFWQIKPFRYCRLYLLKPVLEGSVDGSFQSSHRPCTCLIKPNLQYLQFWCVRPSFVFLYFRTRLKVFWNLVRRFVFLSWYTAIDQNDYKIKYKNFWVFFQGNLKC